MKIVYGPVSSWRLGRSLGIDLICSDEKICSFDCIYCQLGRTKKLTLNREKFVSTNDLEKELKVALNKVEFDVITLSGTGEPTLAKNLSHAVKTIRKLTDTPIAILTNSSLLSDNFVRDELMALDIVVAKLDAHNAELFQRINRQSPKLSFDAMLGGLEKFRDIYSGKLCLQMMFIDENKNHAEKLAELARTIKPEEVQINTPLRSSPVRPLSPEDIAKIATNFRGLNIKTVYESEKPAVKVLDKNELLARRKTVL